MKWDYLFWSNLKLSDWVPVLKGNTILIVDA